MRGMRYEVGTKAFGEVVRIVVLNTESVTGGALEELQAGHQKSVIDLEQLQQYVSSVLDANLTAQLRGHFEKITRPIVLAASLDESAKSTEPDVRVKRARVPGRRNSPRSSPGSIARPSITSAATSAAPTSSGSSRVARGAAPTRSPSCGQCGAVRSSRASRWSAPARGRPRRSPP